MNRQQIAGSCLAILLLLAAPIDGRAQVFIASKPNPEFRIGPLFVTTNIRPKDVTEKPSLLTVNVSWSLLPLPKRSTAEIAQDLYLLWPGEVVEDESTPTDPLLARQVEALGFSIREAGKLQLSARSRAQMGTGAGRQPLGEVPFVTFAGAEGTPRGARATTFIRIPWRPELASLDWLVRLELPMKGAIVPKRIGWLEETFWGRRYVVTLGFGDVGHQSLYPLYFGARDRVVPLARDFSTVLVSFSDSNHLKIEETVPPSAPRRQSEVRENVEIVSLPLLASEGLVPQVLKVQFNYFSGALPWRPILISLFFLVLGNVTGPLFVALARRVARTLRARVHVGRGEGQARESGAVPSREALEKIRPGETSYEEVLRLCGQHAEEQERLPSGETRTLVYRGERVVPHRRRSFGWFSTVSHWDVEHHEIQIEFERDRVRDVQARIRRSRLTQPAIG
jgi:hypothetical protein